MTRASIILVALAVVAGPGCDDAVPGSVLAGARTIAVIAAPPVIALDAASTVTAVVALDGVRAPLEQVAWRACSPWAVIVDPVRDCRGEAAMALTPGAAGDAVVDAAALVQRFGAPPVGSAPASDACPGDVLPVTIVLDGELAGEPVLATKQVRVGLAPPPRRNPSFVRVLADAADLADGAMVPPGATLVVTAELDPAAADPACDPQDPARLELATVTVIAGGGASVSPGSFGVDAGAALAGDVELTAPTEPGPFPLWLIAVEPDGGVAVAYRTLTVVAN